MSWEWEDTMDEKYRYTGQNNKLCPICNKRFTAGPPVIYFFGGEKHQKRWCPSCFNNLQRQVVLGGKNQKEIADLLTAMIQKSFQEKVPEDHKVSGYWFATVPNQGLTLVVEVAYDYGI
jgi:hypothetical protein